jgi:hypothetical protein
LFFLGIIYFWNNEAIILTDYLEQSKTETALCYSRLTVPTKLRQDMIMIVAVKLILMINIWQHRRRILQTKWCSGEEWFARKDGNFLKV